MRVEFSWFGSWCCIVVPKTLSLTISSHHIWHLNHMGLLWGCRTAGTQRLCHPAPLPQASLWSPLWGPVGKCPETGKVTKGKQCVIFIQMDVLGLVQHWLINSVPSLAASCSFLKLYGSCPAQYFRRCLAVSLWLFYCPNFFFPLLHLKCAIKSKMKGPIKENDLSWNLPALWMFPELLAPECCLFPCTTCPVTFHMTLSNLPKPLFWDCFPTTPAVWCAGGLPADRTWLQMQRCTNIWMHCSQSTANISGTFAFFFQAMPVSLSPCWKPWQCTTHSSAVHVDISGSRPGECRADLYGLWIQLLLNAWIMSQPCCQSSVKLRIRKNTMQTCK